MRTKSFLRAAALSGLCAVAASAQTFLLTNGPGNGSVTVRVDGYGFYGIWPVVNQDLMYDDLGPNAPRGTAYNSAVLFFAPGAPVTQWLSSAAPGGTGLEAPALPGIPITQTGPMSCSSTWTLQNFAFTLNQRLCPIDVDGSTLDQVFTVTNQTSGPQDLEMIRYCDVDMWAVFGDDGAGVTVNASGQFNDHMVFAYNLLTETCAMPVQPMCGVTAEGMDHLGLPVRPCGWNVQLWPQVRTGIFMNKCASLGRVLGGDANMDRITCPPGEPPHDVSLGIGTRFPAVPVGGTITFRTRTRLFETLPARARDSSPIARAGNVNAAPTPISPVLHVNGSAGPCVAIPPMGSINLTMAASPAGPNPAHYILYALVGSAGLPANCGGAIAVDFADWSILGTQLSLGTGAFHPGGTFPFAGSGGCPSKFGFMVMSSLPGLAPLTGVAATGSAPGGAIFPSFSLPVSVTLQGVIQDLGTINGTGISVTNAVEIASGTCSCTP